MNTSATLSDSSAGALAAGVVDMTFLALDLADDIQEPQNLPPGAVSYTNAGPQGGAATVTGYLKDDGTYWLEATFSAYQLDGETWNGQEVIQVSQMGSATQPQVGTISFYNLQVTGQYLDTEYTGTIQRQISGITSQTFLVTGSVLLHDLLSGAEWYAQNLSVTRQNVTGGTTLMVQGRVAHSSYGYVDVTTSTPWAFASGVATPDHGGPLVGTGANGQTILVASLTPDVAAVEYTSQPSGKPDRSARVNWTAPATEQIGSGSALPIADGGTAVTVAPGTTRTLDGRFSYQPNGAFLSFKWTLRYRPPGSTAALNDATAAQPQITFDLPGDYLIELTVFDGKQQAVDDISISVRSNFTAPLQPLVAQLPPDQAASVGQSVSCAMQITNPSLGYLPPETQLELYAPDGSAETVGNPSDGSCQFTPTQAGVYRVVLSYPNQGGQIDDMWVAAGTNFRFLPAASMPRPLAGPEFLHYAIGDLNGDGIPDLAISSEDYQLNPALEIYYGNASGGFDPPVITSEGIGGGLVIGDFNGDGLADLAVATSSGVDVLLQQPNGTLSAPQSYSLGCSSANDWAILAAGDFNADGLTDLIVGSGGCGKVMLFTQGADHLLHAAATATTPHGTVGGVGVGDLNGDGVVDLAVAFNSGSPGNVEIIPGSKSAGLGTPQYLSEQFLSAEIGPALTVGDVNGDGRADLLFSIDDNLGNHGIHVYLQQPNGTLQAGTPLVTTALTKTIIVADMNGDGLNDIVVVDGDGPGISIRYQSGGRLAPPVVEDRFDDLPQPAAEAFGLMDVNHDGVLDALAIDTDVSNTTRLVIGYGVAPP
ncbi:MAG: FG-GAP-like repeat-containing protein [Steroidobacteraceae bacterium]